MITSYFNLDFFYHQWDTVSFNTPHLLLPIYENLFLTSAYFSLGWLSFFLFALWELYIGMYTLIIYMSYLCTYVRIVDMYMYVCVTLLFCLSCIEQFVTSFLYFVSTFCHIEFYFLKNVVKSVSLFFLSVFFFYYYYFWWSGVFRKMFLTFKELMLYFNNFFY